MLRKFLFIPSFIRVIFLLNLNEYFIKCSFCISSVDHVFTLMIYDYDGLHLLLLKVQPALHSWDIPNLILTFYLSLHIAEFILSIICLGFLHLLFQWKWPAICLFILIWICYVGYSRFIEWIGICPLLFYYYFFFTAL